MKQLYRVLRNPFYYGGFRWNGKVYEGSEEYHEPLVSRELWNRVQKVLDGRVRSKVTTKEFHYLKMLNCGGNLLDEHGKETDRVCGCSVTAEEKRKRLKDGTTRTYFYYRCSRNKSDGQCSQRNPSHMQVFGRRIGYTEAEIELLFGVVFKAFNWTPELVTRMQEILRAEHVEKSDDHKAQVASLRRRYEMLQTYMDKAYDDKLAGDLAPEQWRDKNERWKREREELYAKTQTLDAAKDEYIENGVLLIELAQHTEKFYKMATPEQKRQLVEIVSSNRVLRDGVSRFLTESRSTYLPLRPRKKNGGGGGFQYEPHGVTPDVLGFYKFFSKIHRKTPPTIAIFTSKRVFPPLRSAKDSIFRSRQCSINSSVKASASAPIRVDWRTRKITGFFTRHMAFQKKMAALSQTNPN